MYIPLPVLNLMLLSLISWYHTVEVSRLLFGCISMCAYSSIVWKYRKKHLLSFLASGPPLGDVPYLKQMPDNSLPYHSIKKLHFPSCIIRKQHERELLQYKLDCSSTIRDAMACISSRCYSGKSKPWHRIIPFPIF